jgi:hypothetical protein
MAGARHWVTHVHVLVPSVRHWDGEEQGAKSPELPRPAPIEHHPLLPLTMAMVQPSLATWCSGAPLEFGADRR